MKQFHWILLFVCIAALIPRTFSVQWNSIPHGDITADADAAASFYNEQRLIVPSKDYGSPYFLLPGIQSNLLVAHPPIWALLGAGMSWVLQLEPTASDAYFALKILSVISGLCIIILSAFLGRRLFGDFGGMLIAMWLAISYLLIDFSGNGALYSLQAVSYIAWIFVAYSSVKHKPVWLGVVSGLGYLVNHQSMILAAGSAVFILISSEDSFKKRLQNMCIVTAVTLAVTFPWLLRNYLIYGNFLFSHALNATYVYVKAAIPHYSSGYRSYFDIGLSERFTILRMITTTWLPNNLYYIARKLFVMAPIVFFFFSFAWIDYLFDSKRVKKMLPIIIICVLHLLISAAWPITKFRYFVPLFPLVLFIGVDQIYAYPYSRQFRYTIIGMITVCFITVSVLTYRAIPTHTYYYDGAITQDPFHTRGEYNFMKDKGLIIEQ